MYSLFLHDRAHARDAVDHLARDALIARHLGHATPQQHDAAVIVLADARARQWWIACACRPERPHSPPLMSPRQLDTGQFALVRHGQVLHALDCPFHRDAAPLPDGNTEYMETGVWTGPPAILKPARNQTTSSVPTVNVAHHVNVTGAPPPLARLLWTRLQEARLTTVDPELVKVTRRLTVVAKDVAGHYGAPRKLDDQPAFGELKWVDICAHHLQHLPGLIKRLDMLVDRFPAGTEPQGFLWAVAHAYRHEPDHSGELIWEDRDRSATVRFRVDGPIAVSAACGSHEGPFWVLGALGRTNGTFALRRAYVQPALGRGYLLPIAAIHERLTGNLLVDQTLYWLKSPQFRWRVIVEKPLFDIPAIPPELRPAFFLRLPDSRRVAVYSSTRDTITVQARAALERVQGIAAAVEHRPGQNDEQFRRLLTAVVGRAVNGQEQRAAR